jgi:flagellar basal body-associated protein FliL
MLYSILIAISLLILLLIGVLALFMAGNRQETASEDRPDEREDEFKS